MEDKYKPTIVGYVRSWRYGWRAVVTVVYSTPEYDDTYYAHMDSNGKLSGERLRHKPVTAQSGLPPTKEWEAYEARQ